MPTFSGVVITEGTWTSQTLDNSLSGLPTGFNGYFGEFSFQFESGDSNSSIHVDILNSSGALLLSDVQQTQVDNFKKVDLSVLPTVRGVDIKIRIRLRAATKSPIVRNLQLIWKDTTNA